MVTRRTKKPAPAPEIEEIDDLDIDELDDVEEEPEPPKPAPKRRTAARKPAARKPAPVVEEVDDDDDEPAPPPKRRGRPAKSATKPAVGAGVEKPTPAATRPEVEFGTNWLVAHVNEQCGTEYKPYDLRVLLRKMAKSGELDREVGSDRSRYSFAGVKDPVVRAVVEKVKSGAVEAEKKASLDKLKERTAAKETTTNVTPIAKKRGRPAKPKPAPVDEEDLDDDDVEDLD